MTEQPKRRPSIHPDDRGNVVDKETNQDLLMCEDCEREFLVNDKDGTGILMTEKTLIEECKTLQKKKNREAENDSSTPKTFKCKGCKAQAAAVRREVPVSTISQYLQCTVFAVIFVAVAIGVLYEEDIRFYLTRNQDIPVKRGIETNADEKLEKQLFELEKMYGNQIEDTWITLTAGIKSVVQENPNKPSTFLMLFDSESAGKTAKCIAQAVSKQAIPYLLKKVDTPKIIYGAGLDIKELLDDPGLLLKNLKAPVQEKGALVVVNLHEVPPKVAKMFHYVCDRYSPFVEKAVTFFTLKVDQMPSQKDLQIKAQETMSDLWSSAMEDNELRPLITRMTSNIIRVYPESGCYGI